jgi:hypothetical protein
VKRKDQREDSGKEGLEDIKRLKSHAEELNLDYIQKTKQHYQGFLRLTLLTAMLVSGWPM